MPRFDPKKHDLTRGEARFLTELYKLSTTSMSKEIKQAEKDVETCKANMASAKAILDKKVKAAKVQLDTATKQHKVLVRQMNNAQQMLVEIQKSGPDDGNKLAKKLGKLCSTIDRTGCMVSKSVGNAGSEFEHAMVGLNSAKAPPGMQIAPSQTKVVIAGP